MVEENVEPRRTPVQKYLYKLCNAVDSHVTWFRETIVMPGRKQYPWYHEKLPRVPTIDQCYTDDRVCMFEANIQYKRDMLVESNIVNILRRRYDDCVFYHRPDHAEICDPLHESYEQATTDWFIKYGELGIFASARNSYMKQKHRMIWERRHGPVGSGMRKSDQYAVE